MLQRLHSTARSQFSNGRIRPVLLLLACCAVASAPGEVAYRNPVVAGDYPDPSVIRVGKDYWATATSSEWGPQFPLLHSRDLVNWELAGSVFNHRPQWATANFWAPEISSYKGRYFVYYVARKQGGPLAVAVATANKPAGPYTDHGPLVAQPDGSIDPVPVTNERGERYLIWKEDGNSQRRPTILWAQPLAEDGLSLTGTPQEILRNDTPWEGAVVEGPFVVQRDGWFYLFYSGNGCCGRNCDYALGVARSRSLLGSWEKNPANPILAGNLDWKCPGHGSIVSDEQGRYWLLYHAYSAKDFIFTGREALLDEVKFGTNGWPAINSGQGPSSTAASPFASQQKQRLDFDDTFAGPALRPGWQWPQDNEPLCRFEKGKRGRLLLSPQPAFANDILGATVAVATLGGDYLAETVLEISSSNSNSVAGIAAVGDLANAVGLAVAGDKLVLWRRDKGHHQELAKVDAPRGTVLHLRLSVENGHVFHFAASSDGKKWSSVGDTQKGDQLPPWDRSIRVGLTAGGGENALAKFESFQLHSVTAKAQK